MFGPDFLSGVLRDTLIGLGAVALALILGTVLYKAVRIFRLIRQHRATGYPFGKKVATPAGSRAFVAFHLEDGREQCTIRARLVAGDESAFAYQLMEVFEDFRAYRERCESERRPFLESAAEFLEGTRPPKETPDESETETH